MSMWTLKLLYSGNKGIPYSTLKHLPLTYRCIIHVIHVNSPNDMVNKANKTKQFTITINTEPQFHNTAHPDTVRRH